jgi:hypothetical protein
MTESPPKRLRSIDVEPDEYSLIKPGELVDIVEMTPLTLQDRRIYNLLILNAWDSITEPKEHCIHKRELRGTHHTSERVGESVERLMGAIARVQIVRDGKPAIRRVQLLAPTDEMTDADGLLYYSFHAGLRAIIKNSSQYARLQKQVVLTLSSKYALALYEMVQKRGNLKHKFSEEFTVEHFRSLLGVEKGKLTLFKSLKQRAIDPAVLEVNGLGEFGCKVEPIYRGKKVIALRLSWWSKNLDERKASLHELAVSRVGRRARLRGNADKVVPLSLTLPPLPSQPTLVEQRQGLTEREMARFKRDFAGLDIEWLEREFREWLADKEPPQDYAAAFYGFMKRKAAKS